MSKLNVLVFAEWYPTKSDPVAGVFIQEQARAAAKYNNIAVVTTECGDPSQGSWFNIDESEQKGLRTVRVSYRESIIPKTTYLLKLLSYHRAYRYLTTSGFRPDIVHAHVFRAGVPAVLVGKMYNMLIIVTEHSTRFPMKNIHGFLRLKAKFAMRRADVILPVSEYLRKSITNFGVKNDFRVVPNVVDTELFRPGSRHRSDDKKRLLLVALLSPKKGVPYLLEALSQLSEVRSDFVLDVVGDGPSREEYEKLSTDLGIDRLVNFHGLKSKQEVAEFMGEADLFVLPSVFETFGVVLIEALSSGLPVVATDIGGPDEIVNEEVGELVPPRDSDSLASAIERVLNNLDEYRSQKIRQYAKRKYGMEAVGKQLDSIYSDLVNS